MSTRKIAVPWAALAETVTQIQSAMRELGRAAGRANSVFGRLLRHFDEYALRERRAKLGGMAETAATNPGEWISTMCIVWMHGECLSDAAHLDCHCHCHQKGTR